MRIKQKSIGIITGTPSFLINEARKRPQSITCLRDVSAFKSTLSDISRLDKIDLVALMFQTGYLTIHDYDAIEDFYILDFPNQEVKQAFFRSLLKDFAEVNPLEITKQGKRVKSHLDGLDLKSFIQSINVQFAKIPYYVFQNAKEGFYQAVFFTFLESSGLRTLSEMSTNVGRIDLMTETSNLICIFELKLDQGADIALTQAETKKYKERFSENKQKTLVMGINFDSKSRTISDWKGVLYLGHEKIKDLFPQNEK